MSVIGSKPVPIVGHSINDYVPFCDLEIQELYSGANKLASEGSPPEIPAMLPLGQIIRMARTVVEYRNKARAVLEAMSKEPRDDEKVVEALSNLSALINLAPPAPVKSRLLVP